MKHKDGPQEDGPLVLRFYLGVGLRFSVSRLQCVHLISPHRYPPGKEQPLKLCCNCCYAPGCLLGPWALLPLHHSSTDDGAEAKGRLQPAFLYGYQSDRPQCLIGSQQSGSPPQLWCKPTQNPPSLVNVSHSVGCSEPDSQSITKPTSAWKEMQAWGTLKCGI